MPEPYCTRLKVKALPPFRLRPGDTFAVMLTLEVVGAEDLCGPVELDRIEYTVCGVRSETPVR